MRSMSGIETKETPSPSSPCNRCVRLRGIETKETPSPSPRRSGGLGVEIAGRVGEELVLAAWVAEVPGPAVPGADVARGRDRDGHVADRIDRGGRCGRDGGDGGDGGERG